jgi:hypothetical protein
VQSLQDSKAVLNGKQYHPADEGKPEFQSKVKGPKDFSDPAFFKTIFISGQDMDKEIAEERKRQQEEFEKKVVVANKHFYVDS